MGQFVNPVGITFPNRDVSGFAEEVKRRGAAYFDESGRSRHATPGMVAKTALLLAVTFVPYALILTNRFSPAAMLGLAMLMGVGVAGIGFAMSHLDTHAASYGNPG